jgi:molybdopterin-guanine dinucleotide biosynthesis protein MobB
VTASAAPASASGLDALLRDASGLHGLRVGLLCNPASVTSRFEPAASALTRAGVPVRVLFGPEHGLTGSAEDMEAVEDGNSAGLPVISLYGRSFDELSPRPEHLADLDGVISDLPDVGSRFDTFVWTTVLMMKACAARGIPLWVLDRPNPLGGAIVEGNLPEDRLLSFVGLYPLPARHGMTPGEIARYVNTEFSLGCDLRVVPLAGAMDSVRSWVQPSPNMPTPATALVYTGSCLFEGTNLSEGRGTTRPFEIVGAPWLDSSKAASLANALGLPGVVFGPHVFRPSFHKHSGRLCGGLQIHVTDPERFRSYGTGLALVKLLRDLEPTRFRWRTGTYQFRSDVPAIDLLTGTPLLRELVDRGAPLDELLASFQGDLERFAPFRRKHGLYERVDPGLHPRTLLIVGAHESGKTTLLVRLIERLAAEGLRVGSLKHTDHEYPTDVPGKDSERHGSAGANPAILVAGGRSAVHRRGETSRALPAWLASDLAGSDVVLVEGYRGAAFPKIEVVRAANGRPPVAADDPHVIAVVCDRETPHAAEIPRVPLHDFEAIVKIVKKSLGVR